MQPPKNKIDASPVTSPSLSPLLPLHPSLPPSPRKLCSSSFMPRGVALRCMKLQ